MKKFLRNAVFALPLLASLLTASPVLAQQKSDYSPLVRLGYSNYKEIYNLTEDVFYQGEAVLTTSHANMALDKIKIFVPPGTKKFGISYLTYLSSQESKVAARFNALPISTAADVNATTMTKDVFDTLKNLVKNDQELNFYSPGGSGVLTLSQPGQIDSGFQSSQGGYIYFHILSAPEGMIKTLQTRMIVDEACYRSWYKNAKWDAQGNPDETATHTCAGSTGGSNSAGGASPPPLTGISLSKNNWNAATDLENTTIKVTPEPANAVLPSSCKSTPENILTTGTASNTEAQFSIIPTAVTKATTVTITCGDQTASINLQPVVGLVTQIKKMAHETDANGNLVLNLILDRPATDIVGKTKTSFWVAARIPKDRFFFSEDEWFFLASDGWKQLLLPNPDSVAYQADKTPVKATIFKIPVGLPAITLGAFNVDIHFGYKDAESDFKDMGVIWKKE